ncbi:MAG: polymer-forming cytoskeletal protein [Bacteroidia bacterium]|nr:polymer-forming cytoskeletal protein [Bacteroidia bacterium]
MTPFFSSGKKDEKKPTESAALSIIAPGTTIEGKVISEGDFRIEGKMIGTIICRSRLVVGNQGIIEGTIDSENAIVAGTVTGTVVIRDVLQIQETGTIKGEIAANKLVVQAGAIFNGNCIMGDEARSWMEKLNLTNTTEPFKRPNFPKLS